MADLGSHARYLRRAGSRRDARGLNCTDCADVRGHHRGSRSQPHWPSPLRPRSALPNSQSTSSRTRAALVSRRTFHYSSPWIKNPSRDFSEAAPCNGAVARFRALAHLAHCYPPTVGNRPSAGIAPNVGGGGNTCPGRSPIFSHLCHMSHTCDARSASGGPLHVRSRASMPRNKRSNPAIDPPVILRYSEKILYCAFQSTKCGRSSTLTGNSKFGQVKGVLPDHRLEQQGKVHYTLDAPKVSPSPRGNRSKSLPLIQCDRFHSFN